MNIPETLKDRIALLPIPYIVAISGFGGAGKTTFASALGNAIGIPVIGIDSFITDRTRDSYRFWNLIDFNRFKTEVLLPFFTKKPVRYGHYDWEANEILEMRELPSAKGIIVEGVGLFRPALLDCFSLSIWLECPIETAMSRGMKRDREVYHNPQDEAWRGIWRRNDEECYREFDPAKAADIIVDNTRSEVAEQAHRLANRLEIHYTPEHGS